MELPEANDIKSPKVKKAKRFLEKESKEKGLKEIKKDKNAPTRTVKDKKKNTTTKEEKIQKKGSNK